ncbi:glycoside hydrolase family 43 protein [Catenovulum sp. 2E275]|uniref:glycoside hydrolase family 43 protein n=1 Tax=Catenovulum sp. 2E275 TaxID=2980497 RepID=UPI0021D26287|nr:glycoside hydrolase family 43 protein [Catenovulum sp. 2E275]MCU4676775.1 glycoside hydrolase family 43 protein [Catenovulum sp. 2E275]
MKLKKSGLFKGACLLSVLALNACGQAQLEQQSTIQAQTENKQIQSETAFIFSSFRGNGQDGLHLAYSHDALNWTAINQDNSLLSPQVGGKLMRDPCIIKGPDGKFHMVWTSSWEDGGIGIAHSDDLINWSEQKFIPTMQDFPTAKNAWAPEIFWDQQTQQYLIYWASTIPGSYPETEKQADKGWDHRIYAVTTKDFESYSDTFLLLQPDFNVIDSTMINVDDEYIMVLKDETRYPPAKNLRVAVAQSALGPWHVDEKAFTPKDVWVEGPTIAEYQDWFYVYFDEYTNHNYGVMRTQDFDNWELVSDDLNMPKGSRHGTIVEVSQATLDNLLTHFGQNQSE